MKTNNIIKNILAIGIISILSGCIYPELGFKNNSFYFKDPRTNLCFVMYRDRTTIPSNVPCTPEVENFIKQQANYEK